VVKFIDGLETAPEDEILAERYNELKLGWHKKVMFPGWKQMHFPKKKTLSSELDRLLMKKILKELDDVGRDYGSGE
jgi:hypothetical protein